MPTLRERAFYTFAGFMFERPNKGQSADALADMLERAGESTLKRIAEAPETAASERLIAHVVGIERWSLSRMRVAQGAPLLEDEYDGYRPDHTVAQPELIALFDAVRRESVALVRSLSPEELAVTVPHNAYGPLTLRGWIGYIRGHASAETLTLR
ncbi:MAG: DinB family protein [Pleurocapsa minor GSE-CHR-MK-17-07R]|jgi:hypothetical protein|nr:DinB family protein [Pleurocapsa minor GSE-CHR-MK 17-07R]